MHQVSLPGCRGSWDVKDRITGRRDPDVVTDVESESKVDGERLPEVVVVGAVELVASSDPLVDPDFNEAGIGLVVVKVEVGSKRKGVHTGNWCPEVNERKCVLSIKNKSSSFSTHYMNMDKTAVLPFAFEPISILHITHLVNTNWVSIKFSV